MKPYYEHAGITIYHGDCREIAQSLPVDDVVIVTDPPYGIGIDVDYRKRFRGGSLSRSWETPIVGDDQPFDPRPWLKYKASILFGANYYSDKLPNGKWLVWNKRDDGPERILADGEMAWHNCPGKSIRVFNWFWIGCYRRGEMGRDVLHPTQKPVELMRWCIADVVAPGVVFDPYMGSGTTLLAARGLGRRAIGIEIEERYCEIAAERLSQEVLDFSEAANEL